MTLADFRSRTNQDYIKHFPEMSGPHIKQWDTIRSGMGATNSNYKGPKM